MSTWESLPRGAGADRGSEAGDRRRHPRPPGPRRAYRRPLPGPRGARAVDRRPGLRPRPGPGDPEPPGRPGTRRGL